MAGLSAFITTFILLSNCIFAASNYLRYDMLRNVNLPQGTSHCHTMGGKCMFSLHCSLQNGTYIYNQHHEIIYCVERLLIKACCKLPNKQQTTTTLHPNHINFNTVTSAAPPSSSSTTMRPNNINAHTPPGLSTWRPSPDTTTEKTVVTWLPSMPVSTTLVVTSPSSVAATEKTTQTSKRPQTSTKVIVSTQSQNPWQFPSTTQQPTTIPKPATTTTTTLKPTTTTTTTQKPTTTTMTIPKPTTTTTTTTTPKPTTSTTTTTTPKPTTTTTTTTTPKPTTTTTTTTTPKPTTTTTTTTTTPKPTTTTTTTTTTPKPTTTTTTTTTTPKPTTTTTTTTTTPKPTTTTTTTTTPKPTTTTTTTTTPKPTMTTTTTTKAPVTSQSTPSRASSAFTTTMNEIFSTIGTSPPATAFPQRKPTYRDICGIPAVGATARIVGGKQARYARHPWLISVRQRSDGIFKHKCGAALLTDIWAITAAHCIQDVKVSDMLLRIGEYETSNTDEIDNHEERTVKLVVQHELFDPRTYEYDLALIRLSDRVVFKRNIIPVCLPDISHEFVGEMGYVAGWGRLYERGPAPNVVHEVQVPVITNRQCEAMYLKAGYREHIPDIFICAGYQEGKRDSCEGDSGGPLVIKKDGRYTIAGIISWGIGCAVRNQPGVYTNVRKFLGWITPFINIE